ncbi:MAG: BrnA antitoxin family protein [Spirochaetes bacterium]|nr:BrnA antitoxin family protein [Spirochaetota bacterium]
MGIIKSTVKVGQKIPKEVIKEIREAAKKPIRYTEDCPPSTPEALKEFAMQRAELNRRKKKQSVTIRVAPDVLESYKTMGEGYTGVMADVLKYAIDNPKILNAAIR